MDEVEWVGVGWGEMNASYAPATYPHLSRWAGVLVVVVVERARYLPATHKNVSGPVARALHVFDDRLSRHIERRGALLRTLMRKERGKSVMDWAWHAVQCRGIAMSMG